MLKNLAALSDQELLAEYCSTRSPDVFNQIIDRHRAMVYRTSLRVLNHQQDAEDASQGVFLILARQPYLVKHALAGWLHEVARRAAIDLLRNRTSRSRREEEVAGMKKPSPAPSPETELREELDVALNRLPGPLREAVVLRYMEGRDQHEAAQLAGCPQGTLAWRCTQGLEKLRSILSRRGNVVTPAVLMAFLAKEATAAVPAMTWSGGVLVAGQETGRAAVVAKNLASAFYWTKVATMGAMAAVVTAIVGVAAAVTIQFQAPSGPAVFRDHFDSSALRPAWSFRGGNWVLKQGVLSQASLAEEDPRKGLILDRTYPADAQITARVRVDAWVDGDYARAGVGLLSDPDNGAGYNLVFHYAAGSRHKVQFLNDLLYWGNGYDFAWEVGVWYWFKLKRENGTLYGKVWRDGSPEPADWPYVQPGWTDRTGGAPALNGGSGREGQGTASASFDDVEVIPVASPAPSP